MANEKKNYLKIHSKIKYLLFLVIYYISYPLAKLLFGRKKNWLICERGDEAQDNGFIFFVYIIKHHKEISPTYVISKKSKEFSKVVKKGKTVEPRTFKHLLMTIGCPVKISSQLFGYSSWVQLSLFYRRNKTRDIHVFLQHGVIKNTHEGLFSKVCRSLDLFVCGAKPEYDFIYNEFQYKNDVPQYTGLARYDLLLDYRTKDQILLMPTWRASLSGVSDETFTNSDYFKNWSALINSERLIQYCRENNLIIKFYLHYSLQKYSHLFNNNGSVSIVNFGDETVQDLLKESKLLVTDFSSVYFDFGYMRKPVVYFQFDESSFNEKHYTKGYFDYRRDGFGDVCIKVEEVIDSINKIIGNNFGIEEKYLHRMDLNFVFRDNKNCERIYKRICELRNKK